MSLVWLLPVMLWATISPNYSEGYTFDPTVSSTQDKEFALSPYKDSTFVFVREDKVYVTRLDSVGELDNPQKCADFDLIKVSGTVAFDKKRNRFLRTANSIKNAASGTHNIFEGLNIRYFGQVDGHDVLQLVKVLTDIKNLPYIFRFVNKNFEIFY